jgi:hypothetical protein
MGHHSVYPRVHLSIYPDMCPCCYPSVCVSVRFHIALADPCVAWGGAGVQTGGGGASVKMFGAVTVEGSK